MSELLSAGDGRLALVRVRVRRSQAGEGKKEIKETSACDGAHGVSDIKEHGDVNLLGGD